MVYKTILDIVSIQYVDLCNTDSNPLLWTTLHKHCRPNESVTNESDRVDSFVNNEKLRKSDEPIHPRYIMRKVKCNDIRETAV